MHKVSKQMKNAHHTVWPQTSLNSLFCPANSPKPKVSLFTIINNKEKQQIVTFLKLETEDVWHFLLDKLLISKLLEINWWWNVSVCKVHLLKCCTYFHFQTWTPTLPTMHFGHWVTSPEAIYQMIYGFFWSHKSLLKSIFHVCIITPQDL